MAGIADEANLLWFGSVEKVGSNLAAHPRVVFVTPEKLLVSLPTGGVTRIIEISSIVEISTSNAPNPVSRVSVHGEQDLVIVLSSSQDAKNFVSATELAREGLRNVNPLPPLSVQWESSSQALATPVQPSSMPEPALQFSGQRPPNSSSKRVSFVEDEQRLVQHVQELPNDGKTSPQHASNHQQWPPNTAANYGKISLHSLQPEAASKPVSHDITVPPSAIQSLQQQLGATQHIVEELRRAQSEDTKIRQELDESKKLVADLQAALRSQDGAFNEMLRAQETLRQHEGTKAALEQRIMSLEEANIKLKRDLDSRDRIIEEQRNNLSVADETHKTEIKTIRETFSDYDSQVTAFVQRIRQECDEKVKALQEHNNELLVEQGKLRSKLELMDASVRQAVQATSGWMPSSVNSNVDESFFAAKAHHQSVPQSGDSSDLRAALIASLHKYADKKFAVDALHQRRQKTATPKRTLSPRRALEDPIPTAHQYNTPPTQWSTHFRDRSLL